MTESIKCPLCNQPITRVGKFWICPTHGQLPEAKPFTPIRIFLSYGHDSNEELVRRIKADLEKRGHDVWFDKSEIKGGLDWRRSITDGIVDSHRVLTFLSKHSTRDPGVCLDEIAIAIGAKGGNIQTILVESEMEVKPPPSISHIQWLDMHDWKERHAAGEAEWEKWYQEKLAEIIAVVESDESRRFAGEIKTLEDHLKPISSDSRIFQLLRKGLVGRTWLVEAIEKWRNAADRASRLFWIMGAPGVGKSAFAAHLAHYGRDKVIAVQFCEYDKPDHRSAHRIVRTLAFQIATRLPDYRKLLLTLPEIKDLDRMNPTELFDYLLTNPLHNAIDGGRERYLIVIDALDEAGGNGHNELVEMLARSASRLPEWIGIVVTSRPENAVIAPLQGLNPFILDTATESNRADIRDYLRRELASHLQNRPDADRLIEQILEKSEGVFLYVERFCEDVQRGHLSLDRPEQFPQGLGGIFFQYFQRLFPDLEKFRNGVRPALRAILAAREPLPLEILQRLFNWQDEELRDFTRPLASLFPVTTEASHDVIKPYHKSLADWLADEAKACDYSVSVKEGHAFLAESSVRAIKSRAEPISVYWLRHALYHLQQCRRASDAAEVAADKWFIDLRIQSGLKNIFLSYSLDATETADRLFADLSRFGHTVLRHANEGANDAQNPASSADMIIALLTRRSTRMRSWSHRETLEAVSQGKVVLPVRATSSELTMPFHLRRPRYIDLSADYVGGLNELCQTLGKSSEIEKYCEDDATDLLPLEELVAQALRLSSEGRLVESEPLYRRALTTVEQNVGADHVDVCQRLEDLGQLLFSTNRLAEAEPLMRRALAIYEKTYGKSHPTVATALNNIAYLLQITNRLAEAEPLMRRAMKIDEQSLGENHPRVATQLNNLAQLLQATNRLAEAELLMRRALKIFETSLGSEHPNVATQLNNLAQLLQTTNRLAEAEPLLRRALAIEEQNFGAGHPDSATALNNLAQLLQATNRLAEAEPLMHRALKIYEQSFGEHHPDVAIALSNLAQLLQATNRLTEAEPLMRRALAIDDHRFGADHPKVALDLKNLAQLLHAANRLEEAEPLMRRALAIDEQSFGPNHPPVATALSDLAQLLHAANRLAESEPLMRRALDIDERCFGKEHPNVARDLSNLANLLSRKEDYAAAEPLYRRALAIWEKNLGNNHPNVISARNNLAELSAVTNHQANRSRIY